MQKSFLSYLGGKSLLANKIIPRIPDHSCYCEVFAGASWILFKKEPSKVEIINDINTDLVTLYRVVKHHVREFVRYFEWILTARDEFERFLAREERHEAGGGSVSGRCACVAFDGYVCWEIRYPSQADIPLSHSEIELDGGPCDCACHLDGDLLKEES